MPLVRVLASMEGDGVALDLSVLARTKGPLQRQLARLLVRAPRGLGLGGGAGRSGRGLDAALRQEERLQAFNCLGH
jgi:hypothetical protein